MDSSRPTGFGTGVRVRLACNGNEIAGGSIRIHRRDIQERVFAVMGLGKDEARENSVSCSTRSSYGAPPHGWDRFRLGPDPPPLSGTDSIRDVIAFPKSGGGDRPTDGAPAPITAEQRKEAGVDAVPDCRAEQRRILDR